MTRRSPWMVVLLALAIGAGCDCIGGGPGLDVDAQGRPAIGWELEGGEEVRGVRVETADGTPIWAIESDGVAPAVIPIGGEVSGFETTVPASGPIDLNGHVLIVDYVLNGASQTAEWPFTDYAYEPNDIRAKVTEYKCGTFSPNVPVRTVVLWAIGLSAMAFLLVAGLAAWLSRRSTTDDVAS